ncbi:MAG: discoidin domain-containing protein [Ardenticatenaceae bacterium]|nr:discoidin domain-containing protein [Ardenticatenaceae bacterium]
MQHKNYLRIFFFSLFMLGLFLVVNEVQAAGVPSEVNQGLAVVPLNPHSPAALPAASHNCPSPTVSGNKPGVPGFFGPSLHQYAFDGTIYTAFISTHDNWQYITIDYKCVGTFSKIRRFMSADGRYWPASGTRSFQGEGVSYSVDGQNWTQLTGSTTTGWQGYVNYRPHAWHTVNYGWSEWLKLNTPVQARYVRFNWDGDNDALHEIQVDFVPDPGLQIDRLFCEAGGGRFVCTVAHSGASGSVTSSWRITNGTAQFTSRSTVTADGTCRIGQAFGVEITMTDSSGHSDTARRSGIHCYEDLR